LDWGPRGRTARPTKTKLTHYRNISEAINAALFSAVRVYCANTGSLHPRFLLQLQPGTGAAELRAPDVPENSGWPLRDRAARLFVATYDRDVCRAGQ
jgi:hypothetical protein